jgi:hypothetical protein
MMALCAKVPVLWVTKSTCNFWYLDVTAASAWTLPERNKICRWCFIRQCPIAQMTHSSMFRIRLELTGTITIIPRSNGLSTWICWQNASEILISSDGLRSLLVIYDFNNDQSTLCLICMTATMVSAWRYSHDMNQWAQQIQWRARI